MRVAPTNAVAPRETRLEQLRRQIDAVESGAPAEDMSILSTGVPALDSLLPRGGLRRGSVVEWLGGSSAGGAQTLAFVSAREACRDGKSLVVVDKLRQFYPPAAAAWGIDLSRLIVIHPASDADELWAIDQALRCRGIAAVWAKREQLDSCDFRRLQLAAESGGTVGLLVRSTQVRGQPSWADAQFLCAPLSIGRPFQAIHKIRDGLERPSSARGWQLRVELTRSRGSHTGQSVELEIDEWTGHIETRSVSEGIARHETHPLRPAAQLAPSAAGHLVAV